MTDDRGPARPFAAPREAEIRRPPHESAAVRATLNPVLIACVVAWSAKAYRGIRHEGLPWPLAYVVASVVLHPPTRATLPSSTARRLLLWRRDNEMMLVDSPRRAIVLRPFVDAGIRVGMRTALLSLDGGHLLGSIRQPARDSELYEIAKSSAFLGRWFAPLPTSSVLAQFGMRP